MGLKNLHDWFQGTEHDILPSHIKVGKETILGLEQWPECMERIFSVASLLNYLCTSGVIIITHCHFYYPRFHLIQSLSTFNSICVTVSLSQILLSQRSQIFYSHVVPSK